MIRSCVVRISLESPERRKFISLGVAFARWNNFDRVEKPDSILIMENNITETAIVADTTEAINVYRILSLKAALGLEAKGMRHSRGFSAYATVKREMKLKGDRMSVLHQLEKIVENLLDKRGQVKA
jgi:hypothetical protein